MSRIWTVSAPIGQPERRSQSDDGDQGDDDNDDDGHDDVLISPTTSSKSIGPSKQPGRTGPVEI